ncbi:hypothetical protein VH571_07300 [Frondihabitans sp. 4ASC-45]|uniref:hypothetical protein n=1 Tax=Frondihabitans sp. 4ASC-45 TaxID=3111636 RepID=UPI003C2553E6
MSDYDTYVPVNVSRTESVRHPSDSHRFMVLMTLTRRLDVTEARLLVSHVSDQLGLNVGPSSADPLEIHENKIEWRMMTADDMRENQPAIQTALRTFNAERRIEVEKEAQLLAELAQREEAAQEKRQATLDALKWDK